MRTTIIFDGSARIARIRHQFALSERRRRESWGIFLTNHRNKRRRLPHHFPAIDLGPLPVELVSSFLRRTLAPGVIHFSSANQDHAFARHGQEFLSCLPHVGAAVLDPEYIGQGPDHPQEFEMVRAISGLSEIGGHVLVALTLEIGAEGRYMIQSVYPINRGTVFRRIRKRHLFRVGASP
jgi:hypothetical protein